MWQSILLVMNNENIFIVIQYIFRSKKWYMYMINWNKFVTGLFVINILFNIKRNLNDVIHSCILNRKSGSTKPYSLPSVYTSKEILSDWDSIRILAVCHYYRYPTLSQNSIGFFLSVFKSKISFKTLSMSSPESGSFGSKIFLYLNPCLTLKTEMMHLSTRGELYWKYQFSFQMGLVKLYDMSYIISRVWTRITYFKSVFTNNHH